MMLRAPGLPVNSPLSITIAVVVELCWYPFEGVG